MAQISALGCEDMLTTSAAQDVKVGADNFDCSQVNPETLQKAKQVWVSLITTARASLWRSFKERTRPTRPGASSCSITERVVRRNRDGWHWTFTR